MSYSDGDGSGFPEGSADELKMEKKRWVPPLRLALVSGRHLRYSRDLRLGRPGKESPGMKTMLDLSRKKTFLPLRNQRGMALLMVLVAVVVVGLMLGIAGSTWKTVRQREREKELLFRGRQYRQAIESYYKQKHGGAIGSYPTRLKDLLLDPRSLQPLRHIRKLYPDPMTGGDWVLIKDPAGRIKGVHSSSTLQPFKQGGFRGDEESFNGAQKYSDWQFVYKGAPAASAAAAGQPAATTPTNPATPTTQTPQSGQTTPSTQTTPTTGTPSPQRPFGQ